MRKKDGHAAPIFEDVHAKARQAGQFVGEVVDVQVFQPTFRTRFEQDGVSSSSSQFLGGKTTGSAGANDADVIDMFLGDVHNRKVIEPQTVKSFRIELLILFKNTNFEDVFDWASAS